MQTTFIKQSCTQCNEPSYEDSEFCSISCRDRYTSRKHKNSIKEFIRSFKKECFRCGYDRCFTSLDFHHKNADEKEFEMNDAHHVSKARIKAEIEKCVVLCKNCHHELHAGIWALYAERIFEGDGSIN